MRYIEQELAASTGEAPGTQQEAGETRLPFTSCRGVVLSRPSLALPTLTSSRAQNNLPVFYNQQEEGQTPNNTRPNGKWSEGWIFVFTTLGLLGQNGDAVAMFNNLSPF